VCQAPKLHSILEKIHKIVKNGVRSSQKNGGNKTIPRSDDSTTEIPTKRKDLMEEAKRNKSPTNSTRIWWLWEGFGVRWVWERERESEGDGGSNKWKGKERKREGEEKKEEAVAGQSDQNRFNRFCCSVNSKTRRKRRWLSRKPVTLTAQSAKLTAQTAGLTDSADAEVTKTGSTGSHQRKSGWVAYSAGLLN
jgi:hypothetical protein